MRILYIDDDPDDRHIFLEAVRSIDETFVCTTAKDGLDALSFLDSRQLPHVIFLDINMPLMSGITCLAEIKGNKNTAHIPVIIFTTSSNLNEMEQCMKIGAKEFLHKPSSYREMKEILMAVFQAIKNTSFA
jgi:CheY-like chemotaxis protein